MSNKYNTGLKPINAVILLLIKFNITLKMNCLPQGQHAEMHVIHPPIILEMSEIMAGHGAQCQNDAGQHG